VKEWHKNKKEFEGIFLKNPCKAREILLQYRKEKKECFL
jgi:hypothetical protein